MGQFSMPKGPMNQATWDRALKAVKDAVEKADYDSGWIPTPANRTITHNLGVLPSFVAVYDSDEADGDGYGNGTFTSVNRNTITISGPKAFVRVWLDK